MAQPRPQQAQAPQPARGHRSWLPLGLGAAVLALLSQLLWWWQSWPVRQLMQDLASSARPLL